MTAEPVPVGQVPEPLCVGCAGDPAVDCNRCRGTRLDPEEAEALIYNLIAMGRTS